jgi:hypothetical protein
MVRQWLAGHTARRKDARLPDMGMAEPAGLAGNCLVELGCGSSPVRRAQIGVDRDFAAVRAALAAGASGGRGGGPAGPVCLVADALALPLAAARSPACLPAAFCTTSWTSGAS